MRPGHPRHGSDRLDAQNSQIGLPALELEEGIVIETQPDG
jgi:hypothetical protein